MFDLDNKTIEIMTSRDSIRRQLSDYLKQYLELENVDLYYTSFLSYILNILSILSANQLYYTSTIYKEFFLTEAQLEESVYNLSKWIGYTPDTAQPARCDVLMTIPLTFSDPNVNFIIPYNFQIKSGDIVYTTDSSLVFKIDNSPEPSTGLGALDETLLQMESDGINVQVLNNKAVTVRNELGYFYPVLINSDNKQASFMVPFVQYELQNMTFQVPHDLEIYQFWSIPLEYNGQLWKIQVFEIHDNSGHITEEEIYLCEGNSLYTMTSKDKKYAIVSSVNKAEIFFGNGVIGKQPTKGSIIKVVIYLTKGEEGRVIASTLTNPNKLYYTSYGKSLPLKIITINPSPAEGGSDVPTISQIKSRAISNLRSKGNLVSEGDYNDLDQIIPNIPLAEGKPILKRSDVKINEIMLFTKLQYENLICPTRNIIFPINSTGEFEADIIPAKTPIDIDGEIYETLFTMQPNLITREAEYLYIINNINVSPTLYYISQYAQYCYIILTNCNFQKEDHKINIYLNLANIVDEITDFRCEMQTMWDGNVYMMGADLEEDELKGFYFEFDDYLDIPLNKQSFRFTLYGTVPPHILGTSAPEERVISSYQLYAVIRQNLKNFMTSSISLQDDNYYIHNVPIIKQSYFTIENTNRSKFELKTLQTFINNIQINNKKMLTDFINIKCCDTTGKLTNMKYNYPNKGHVVSKTQEGIPLVPLNKQQWLINGKEDPTWFDKRNMIAQWIEGTGWKFINCSINDTILVTDEDNKLYVYTDTGSQWIEPIFDIPFQIQAIITKDPNLRKSSSTLIQEIKQKLLEHFISHFGMDKNFDRSEIIKVMRGVPGTYFVKLLKPEIDIKFRYDITQDLTQEELLDYTPQLVCFIYDSISISVNEELV